MLSSTRRALVVGLGTALLGGLSALQLVDGYPLLAQVMIKRAIAAPPGGPLPVEGDQPADPNDLGLGVIFLTDTKLKGKIEAGRDYIRDKDWPKATHILQGVLDLSQDALVEVAI